MGGAPGVGGFPLGMCCPLGVGGLEPWAEGVPGLEPAPEPPLPLVAGAPSFPPCFCEVREDADMFELGRSGFERLLAELGPFSTLFTSPLALPLAPPPLVAAEPPFAAPFAVAEPAAEALLLPPLDSSSLPTSTTRSPSLLSPLSDSCGKKGKREIRICLTLFFWLF